MRPFSRRGFLLALPALAVGAELLVPKKTIFLPPRCGWDGSIQEAGLWACVLGEHTFYYRRGLADLLRNKALEKYPIVRVRSKTERILYPAYENKEWYSEAILALHNARMHCVSI